jgi:hypothetical protein
VRNDLDLSIALLRDGNGVAKVASASLDLDAVVQELLKGLDVEDLVVDGLRAVDDELCRLLAPVLHRICACSVTVTYLLGDLLALLRRRGFLLHVAKYLAYCSMREGAQCSAQRTAKQCTYG